MKPNSKYYALFTYLELSEQAEIILTFSDLERLLERKLPPSAWTSRGWWSNRRRGGVLQASAWIEAGYLAEDVDLEAKKVTFRKPKLIYVIQRRGGTILWDKDLIKALRLYTGWTQAQLADEMGIRQQTVSDWETKPRKPLTRSMSKHLHLVANQAGFVYLDEEQEKETTSE